MTNLTSFFRSIAAAFVLIVAFAQSAAAIDIKTVKTKSGITAYLVEDYTLPMISLSFSFKGGMVQDPPGKTGLVRLMTSLLDEGAGPFDSTTYRAKLEENGIELGFSSGREALSGRLRTVTSEREMAFEMLRLALNEPRFDDEAVERMRNAIKLGIIRSKTNPDAVSAKTLRQTLFGSHPYSRSSSGDEETIVALSREDITNVHTSVIAKDNLFIGVVGAISEEELVETLESVFGNLPEKSNLAEIVEAAPNLGALENIAMPVPNTSMRLVYKGLKRSSPDFFAAHLMNYILGGGSFSSRLYEAVREQRGLAYSVSSGLVTLDHTAYLVAGTSTRADNQALALQVMRDEIERFATEGVTEAELKAAKKYVIGSYAINNLDTSGKIARVLVALQSEKLGIDYIDKRAELIQAVTLDDVNRLARELLSVEPTVVTVGPAVQ